MSELYLCDNTRIGDVVELCETHGFGIEVQAFFDPAYTEQNKDAVAAHREALQNVPKRSMHGPFGDLCPGSFDVMVRDLARYRFESALRIAEQLDINRLILHHGYVPNTSPPDKWLPRTIAFWNGFLADKPSDLRVHLETHLEPDPDMLRDLIDTVGDPRLSICLDIGHVHCFSPIGLPDWIKRLGTRIRYVHLHDNHGVRDEHLALGRGTIPVEKTLHALQNHAPSALWAIEASPIGELRQSLEWLKTHGFI